MRVGERLLVLDIPAMDNITHGDPGDFARLGAGNIRNLGDDISQTALDLRS